MVRRDTSKEIEAWQRFQLLTGRGGDKYLKKLNGGKDSTFLDESDKHSPRLNFPTDFTFWQQVVGING
jgi:hypothetical protein